MTTVNSRVVIWALLIPVWAGCGTHGVPHVAPDESRPHVSWEIRAGGEFGDAGFVCGTAQPGKPCVLAAAAEKTRTLVTVQMFAHAAAQPTSFLGFMRASFLEGSVGRKLGEINTSIQPGSRPVATTISGQVTSKPGNYALTISVDATQPSAPNPTHISEEIPVVVK
jgi:hypothetical protein